MEFKIRNKRLGIVPVQVSDEDADLALRRWYLTGGKGGVGRYVATRNEAARTIYLHRLIAVRMGLIPDVIGGTGSKWAKSVDHENGDKMDNRRGNLLLKTRKQQMTNLNDGLQRNNTSGVRGVSYIVARRRWYAHVMVDHKSKSLGYYATFGEAVAARESWDTGCWQDPEPRPRSNNTSGHPGVSYAANRAGPRRWYAYGTTNGRMRSLGHYPTLEEAVAARRAWEAAH